MTKEDYARFKSLSVSIPKRGMELADYMFLGDKLPEVVEMVEKLTEVVSSLKYKNEFDCTIVEANSWERMQDVFREVWGAE